MNRLAGQVAIVTGAGSGIGRATARLFAAEGAAVVHCDRSQSGTDETQALLEQEGARAAGIVADIALEATADRLVRAAVERFGKLTTLMNNAGIGCNRLTGEMPLEEWDRVHNVNVRAQFILIKAALPELIKAGGGSIVNVASVMAEATDYGLAPYCSSKAGVAGLTRTVALEYGKYGIRANYIMPGPIYTGLTRDNFDQEKIKAVWEKKTALRRLGQPEDMARVALFLASDDAGYVTGAGIRADGGLMLRT
ncbi:MAG TPA: SDR family NAD(P)-dependent oxidoreductase [Candidatus Binataceae bacterium]|nr:SDR family NAD(P)-dependent oxidoreductase [Candidatus Binataceae bacterium]